MNNRTALLRETATWMDTIDLGLCMFIYGVCNEYQFDTGYATNTSSTMFRAAIS